MNPAKDLRLSERVSQVRKISNVALSRYTLANETGSRETILLKDGTLAGFCFTLGQFSARWLIGDDSLKIFRDLQPMSSIPIESGQEFKRAA